ncbi:MAG TPA: phosphopantetheine adenylyltransferase [Candidatus Methanoculleus thermohydrogenotrophicum]|mgnify:FL=1|jgi:pantetheine-phosphate adenylyltransferase|nr:phosphopantetheine adenylyltransferase [Candidatus Methanoculleus thermohydrogenotrophicum]NLM81480.1 phosphopantetheine adenylyltransferase [Candidatus Methanoculleus thermohydrogenotrophicum]HOB18171.1 phosphopantetheine adenylyltransferase [Candidatus Methanoculleus thermohydrogenotrophicum]HPZ38317.1 phosphopantetheine adenylyltransferase [Candidatus Methanoculleus thermohydrogenotrophicum]HQC91571.1 phosphopantetheine adenylyltransferase [Candidatus Methanoculleus thermohydrogenotrophic
MKVMVGGTFDPLHAGHKKLLARSFELAGPDGEVIIGLTTDEFAGSKEHPVRPYQERLANVASFIKKRGYTAEWKVEPLSDRYGSSLDVDFDILVVSEETFPVAVEINELRRQRGRRKVDLHEISCVLAEDGRRISSTRVYRGEIDRYGRLVR